MSSGRSYSSGGGSEKPVNSLLNAFVPDDLVTFSIIPPVYSLPTTVLPTVPVPVPVALPTGDGEMISEIDLSTDENSDIIGDSRQGGDSEKDSAPGHDHDSGFNYGEPSGIVGMANTPGPSFEQVSTPQIITPQSFPCDTQKSVTDLTATGPRSDGQFEFNHQDQSAAPSSADTSPPEPVQERNPDRTREYDGYVTHTPAWEDPVAMTTKVVPAWATPAALASWPGPPVVPTGSELLPAPGPPPPPASAPPTAIGMGYPVTVSGDGLWPLGQLSAGSGTGTTGPNTFRLGKKPVYAKYPGLNSDPYSVHNPVIPHPLPSSGITPMPLLSPPEYIPIPNSNSDSPFLIPGPSSTLPVPDYVTTPPVVDDGSYQPVRHYWFYRKDGELWKAFSQVDSNNLEEGLSQGSNGLVSVDGGRQDVDLEKRIRQPVYWEDTEVTHVQRCSWFYKGAMDSQYLPYSEQFSGKLEAEYESACRTNTWQKRLELTGGEAVVLQGPHTFVHFCKQASPDEWGSVPESQLRPRVVKRGPEGLHSPAPEPVEIDYLVFLVHGIGSFCDFKFRTVVETVDDFRHISNQLIQTHFKDVSGRVEFLPIQWHKALHGDGGIDEKLKPLTLKSIPKLRHFTNDTLLDILFYTSPVYCQTIMDTVGNEMNRLYSLFLERNPSFNCLSVAVGGHSLGSLILFDLLQHQPELVPMPSTNLLGTDPLTSTTPGSHHSKTDGTVAQSRLVSYRMGSAGTGQPSISYPVLDFQPTAFFAMGSPIAMFVAVRGLDSLGLDFHFPTCPAFFNIFHPYDPVAYRIESLIDPMLDLRPVLIPHHKGRKRFHLELKETMTRVGTDLKNRVMESLRVTYRAVTQLTGMAEMEREVDNAIASELNSNTTGSIDHTEEEERKKRVGSLNGGRRIDHVLQEAPHQILNEYLFALSSHVCYWESEDTMLLILNEILNEGRSSPSTPSPTLTLTDQQFQFPDPPPLNPFVPQSSDPPPLLPSTYVPPVPLPGSSYTSGKRPVMDPSNYIQNQPMGMDPTAPISIPGGTLAPPPKSGFKPKN